MTWREYAQKLKDLGYEGAALDKIKRAFEFASESHKNEKRFSGEPYINHPLAVSLGIAELKLNADAVAAALLHDVVENQGVKLSELKKEFGEETAFLVDGVTKVDRIRYRGLERTTESLRKMFLALAEDIRVVLIKLMDRLHNMKTLEHIKNPEKRKRIALETLEIYAPLADRLGIWEIKAELEDLAFPYVFPEENEWLMEQISERREESKRQLLEITPLVETELKKEGVKIVKILYRVKNSFSIWQKLVKYEMDFGRILDITAMRLVVEDVEDCYRALGIIHKLWKPVPGKIKDYIALPKPNGYQSLHTSVFGPKKKIVEFQIRTDEMDREAEYGIAAHWAYKTTGKEANTKKIAEDKKLRWVRQLQDWYQGQQTDNSGENLKALKIELFKDRIFVLTPKGDVFDLPESASPIDFAYQVHSEIGDRMFGARVNGKLVPFSYELKSGETVEIITQKNKKPTVDWLDFAKTSLAKNRIRAYLRKEGVNVPPANVKKEKRLLEAVITAKDRVGMLNDITKVFSRLKINLADVKADFKNKNFPRIILSFSPHPNLSNAKIMTEIKKVSDVESVSISEKKN